MLYSFTSFSTCARVACAGAQTIIGIPQALAYSNMVRSSSGFFRSMLPPLRIFKPGVFEILAPLRPFLGRRFVADVKLFDADVLDIELLDDLDGLRARKLAQGIVATPSLMSSALAAAATEESDGSASAAELARKPRRDVLVVIRPLCETGLGMSEVLMIPGPRNYRWRSNRFAMIVGPGVRRAYLR